MDLLFFMLVEMSLFLFSKQLIFIELIHFKSSALDRISGFSFSLFIIMFMFIISLFPPFSVRFR